MIPESKSEIILYQTEDNWTRIEVRLENETVWLTQAQTRKSLNVMRVIEDMDTTRGNQKPEAEE